MAWKRKYPVEMLYDVVAVMHERPELPYAFVLAWACRLYGIEA